MTTCLYRYVFVLTVSILPQDLKHAREKPGKLQKQLQKENKKVY